MSRTFDYFKEDMAAEELDIILYKQEQEEQWRKEIEEQERKHKIPKIILGKTQPRFKNRKFKAYVYLKHDYHNYLPF